MRPDNLWEPIDANEDHGAHGRFDSRSHSFSVQTWADLHRGVLGAVVGGAAGLAGAFLYAAKHRQAA